MESPEGCCAGTVTGLVAGASISWGVLMAVPPVEWTYNPEDMLVIGPAVLAIGAAAGVSTGVGAATLYARPDVVAKLWQRWGAGIGGAIGLVLAIVTAGGKLDRSVLHGTLFLNMVAGAMVLLTCAMGVLVGALFGALVEAIVRSVARLLPGR